jgi:hypothetical protein
MGFQKSGRRYRAINLRLDTIQRDGVFAFMALRLLFIFGANVKDVAHPPDCLEELWSSRVFLDNLSYPPDVDIKGPGIPEITRFPYRLHKPVPVEHFIGVPQEFLQQAGQFRSKPAFSDADYFHRSLERKEG